MQSSYINLSTKGYYDTFNLALVINSRVLTLIKEEFVAMTREQIIMAWRDPSYYESLSEAQKAMIPPNPAGNISASASEIEVNSVCSSSTEWCPTMGVSCWSWGGCSGGSGTCVYI